MYPLNKEDFSDELSEEDKDKLMKYFMTSEKEKPTESENKPLYKQATSWFSNNIVYILSVIIIGLIIFITSLYSTYRDNCRNLQLMIDNINTVQGHGLGYGGLGRFGSGLGMGMGATASALTMTTGDPAQGRRGLS